ncbi:MAG: methyl-accepting chemotaxis protein, partial [Micromonosporaceae bacterium]
MLRFTVGRKLALVAAVGLVVAGAIGGVSYVGNSQIKTGSDLRKVLNKANLDLTQLDVIQGDARIAELTQIMSRNDAERKSANEDLATVQQSSDAVWAELDKASVSADLRQTLDEVHRIYTAWLQDVTAKMPALAALDPGSGPAHQATTDAATASAALGTKVDAAREAVQKQVDAARVTSDSTIASVKDIVVIALLVGVALLLTLSVLISRSITRPLVAMVTALRSIAKKDLTTEINVRSGDELGDMAGALGEAVGEMRAAMTTIGNTSATLASASEELNAVSTQLGSGAEETSSQAGTVSVAAEEVSMNVSTMAAAAEEMTASINEISRSATSAAGVATEA